MFVLEEGCYYYYNTQEQTTLARRERVSFLKGANYIHEFGRMKLLQAVAQELSLAKTEDIMNG